MIFTYLKGLLSPAMAPITYFLVAINVFVFAVTFESYEIADSRLDTLMDETSFIETQGSAFAVMIKREPKTFSKTLRQLSDHALGGEADSRRLLGSLAMRNVTFMERAETYDFGGDEIALGTWREKFTELKEAQGDHPSYQWGLSQGRGGWLQWITYQFSHSGFMHLFWNMAFLIVFGCFIETTLGGSFVILTYLVSGLVGAAIFSKLSGISSSPLVGASASVSGLMSLVAFYWMKRDKVKFFYWLLPVDGYFGFVALPSWLVLVVSFLPDIAGYIAASEDLGSIAYSAHLGGGLWGGAVALLLTFGVFKNEHDEPQEPGQSGGGKKVVPLPISKDADKHDDDNRYRPTG